MRNPPELELPEFLTDIASVRPEPLRAAPRADHQSTVESGLWVFILGDMTLFGAFFAGFAWHAQLDPALFASSARELLIDIGALNTLVLLTSSLFVVAAVRAMNAGVHRQAARAIAAALACALVFAALKVTEYVAEIDAGFTPGTNLFFTYYYVLTGIHLLHVLIGALLLFATWRGLRRTVPGVSARFVEGAGIYWHMVDLLWVVLFPLLYIARLA